MLTNACAGSKTWAGSGVPNGQEGKDNRYQCPQQKLFVPLSRMHDGICDCCDGSDEPAGHCNDICDSVLEEERKLKKNMLENFQIGKKKRDREINDFRRVIKHTIAEISELEAQIPPLGDAIKLKSVEVKQEKDKIFRNHLQSINRIANEFRASGEWDAILLGNEGMVEFIAASCQLYGESTLAKSKNKYNKDKLCEPLKTAAIDIGILWDGSNVKIGTQDEVINEFMVREGLMDVAEDNEEWVDPEDAILDEMHYDDDDEGDHTTDYYDDDDAVVHEERKSEKVRRSEDKRESNTRVEKKHGSYDGDEYKAKFGMLMRSTFLEKAEKVMSHIDDLLKDDEDMKADEDKDDDDNSQDANGNDEGTLPPDFDPMAVQMVRNVLTGRIGQVQYGDELARSAKSMLKSLQETLGEDQYASYLEQLVIGVTNLSQIGEADVEEIITVINADVDGNSCFSLYTTMCSKDRAKDSIAQRCAERSDINSCEDSDARFQLPSNIHNGYFNYYVPQSRGPDDRLGKVFAEYGYDEHIFENTDLPSLNQEVEDARQEVKRLNTNIQKLKEDVGMTSDSPKFDKSGELYALRDECFDVTIAKYTYELCLFGKAYQREGTAKKGGTDLGKWKGNSISKETGARVWKWKDGAKCWNGPKRSATVFITCGAETKLISADEPNICEYEFRMESHIGCDDKFKAAHDL